MELKGLALRNRGKGKEPEFRKDKIVNALTGVQTDSLVSVSPNSTNTQSKSTPSTSQTIETTEMQQQLFQENSQTSISSQQAFLASLSQLLESGEDLKIHGVLSSSRYAGLRGKSNPDYFCLRTSKDCSHTITVRHFTPSYHQWTNWGMTSNGKCLIARISESHKTGKECSLSDILEEHPDPKYFLSERATSRLFKRGMSSLYLEQSQQKIKVGKLNGMGVRH